MIKIACLFTTVIFYCLNAIAQQDIPVFESGKDGYKTFRIPAIISLPNGDLLAFCEGRVNNAGDFGDIDIVMKRSADKGKTWSALQVIADTAGLQAGNPAPVVDLTDPAYPGGRIFLFYNTGNNHESEVRKGNGLREAWYKTSADGGTTWSAPVNITLQVHKPRQPQVNPLYNFIEDWRCTFNTPGHAMQFTSGKYKGRIFVAANHSAGDLQKTAEDYTAHGYYTDDHGKTFRLSENVNRPGSNESIATELSNNRLMMNSRNQKGDVRARIVSISSDGGASWDTTYFDNNLIDPVCQASLLTIGKKKGKHILAFTNPAAVKARDSLTLRVSYDDGRTWKKSYLLAKSESGHKGAYSAYSDIVKLSKRKLGVLFEKESYSVIVFRVVNWR